jgi:DNA polymerase
MSIDLALLQAYLRQRAELGETEVFLASMDRREVMRLLAVAKAGGVVAEGETAARAHTRARAQGSDALVASEADTAVGETPRAPPRPRVPVDALVSPPPALGLATPAVRERPTLDPVRALHVLREDALACTRCGLRRGATQVVFGDGTVQAEVVVVGEAPGADEDRTGVPFVGRAGKMLDLLLGSVGFPRERVYICNVLKCRPPGNRDPQPDEVHECSPWLKRQIELIRPRVLLAVGRFAAQTLTGSDAPMNRLRGRVHSYEGTPLVATYHPSYLLRTPGDVRKCWEDLQLLRRTFDATAT